MIVTENVTMYKCEHCPKRYFRKQDIVKHEFNCNYNPKNFAACSGCKHLEEKIIEYPAYENSDCFEGTTIRTTTGFFCKKLEKKMYPFKAVKKGLPTKYPETFKDQIQMPNACDLREEQTFDEMFCD